MVKDDMTEGRPPSPDPYTPISRDIINIFKSSRPGVETRYVVEAALGLLANVMRSPVGGKVMLADEQKDNFIGVMVVEAWHRGLSTTVSEGYNSFVVLDNTFSDPSSCTKCGLPFLGTNHPVVDGSFVCNFDSLNNNPPNKGKASDIGGRDNFGKGVMDEGENPFV